MVVRALATSRCGWTLIELLTALGVLGVLTGLLVPAVMLARESARRMQCQSNLRQIGLAIASYESTHGMFPPGGEVNGWLPRLLPYLGHAPLFEVWENERTDYYHPVVSNTRIPLFVCPTESGAGLFPAPTTYAGNLGTGVLSGKLDGIIQYTTPDFPSRAPGRVVRIRDVHDGLSNTAAVSELLCNDRGQWGRLRTIWKPAKSFDQIEDLVQFCESLPVDPASEGWKGVSTRGESWTDGTPSITGYTHATPPNRPSCYNGSYVPEGIYSAASAHSGGVYILFADGHVTFEGEQVDRKVWRALGSRSAEKEF